MMSIQKTAEDVTLRATLLRIKRKADIMALDAPRGTLTEQNAIEFQLLAGIALRCIGVDSEARQDSHEEKRRKHTAVMDDSPKICVFCDVYMVSKQTPPKWACPDCGRDVPMAIGGTR
jgi:competence CoiA-like predicted nuclease